MSMGLSTKIRSADEETKRILLRSLVGALGGVSATGPMTIGMVWLHRLLPAKHRYSLPPREITMDLLEGLGFRKKLGPDARAALTLINHFGYGAAAAIVYSLAEWRVAASPLIKGPIFGALVWLVSYLGVLPALGVLDPATKHPHSRNVLMFVVHLVWGVFVGAFVNTLLSEKKRVFGAILSASPLPQRDRT
jgi:uncharacterized membrane protein YagU involved in acid resistance